MGGIEPHADVLLWSTRRVNSPGFAPVLPWQIVSGFILRRSAASHADIRNLTNLSAELQHDLTPVRTGAVLYQVDRLPCAEREFSVKHGHLQRSSGQHGLHMRRHVVRSLG